MSYHRTMYRLAAFLFFSSTFVVFGQIRSATVAGSARDTTDAIVAGADITIHNEQTNISNTTKTTDAGQFVFPYLQAGRYAVTITAQGFNVYRQTGIELTTGQTFRVDAILTPSAVQTTIEVQASAAQIQTDSATVGGSIQSQIIDVVPNPTQNPLYYAFLQAGLQVRDAATSITNNSSFGIGVNGRRQYSAVGVNGGRAFTNDIQLDGLPVMGGGYNEAAVIPNTEGLQEVRVVTNNFSAEYGRGQGVIQMSTKSGTNEIHGQGSYMIRNDALNANTNANKSAYPLVPRVPFKVHQLGGSISGPILRNRLFYTSSYHYLRYNRRDTTLSTVPTALEKVGNFSQTMTTDPAGQPVPAAVFDPYNVKQLAPDYYQRAPYPNATIPGGTPWYSAALYMNSFYPEPNRPPTDVYNSNNYGQSALTTIRRQSSNNRLDYRIGQHSIYGSGGYGWGTVTTPRPFGQSPFNGAPSITSDRNPYAQVGDTIVLSPSLLLDVRYGVVRIQAQQLSGDKSGFTDYEKVGVPKNLYPLMQIYGAAPVVNNYSGGSGGGSNWTALTGGNFGTKYEWQMTHSFAASVTKVRGAWTHKFGVDIRNILSNYSDLEEASVAMPSPSNSGSAGNFTFQYLTAAGASRSENQTNQQKGINGAAMFTGAGVWWIRPANNLLVAFGQRYAAFYSQNDWRATSKLTINLGLRWDYQPGPTERYNRISSLDLEAKSPFGTQGTLAFAGTNGYGRNLWETRYDNWGPRLGLAYQALPDLVIRGGFGVSYLPSNTGYFSGPNDYGSSSFGSGVNMLPYGVSPDGVPTGRFTDAPPLLTSVSGNLSAPSVWGVGETRFDHHLKNGLSKQWNIFIEKTFARKWFASVGYSASASRNLSNRMQNIQSSQMVPASVLTDWKSQWIANSGTTNPASQLVANPVQPNPSSLIPYSGTLGQATISRSFLYYPYPYLYSSTITDSRGFADFHSLQTRLSRAFADGFRVDVNYTFSKELDYTSTATEDGFGSNRGGTPSAYDLLNLRNNRKLGAADQKHVFNAVPMYALPIGPGKHFNPSNKILSHMVGNWEMASVITLRSGMPIMLSGATDGALVAHPDRIPGVDIVLPKEYQKWYDGNTSVTLPCGRVVTPPKNTTLKYNLCAFQGRVLTAANGKVINDVYWRGYAAANFDDLRAVGRTNVDFTLRRTFMVRENVKLQLSAEATNLLNQAQYNGTYSASLGNTLTTANSARGQTVGQGSNDTFGTMGLGTFEPRNVTIRLLLRF
jgi:hypothetical protein